MILETIKLRKRLVIFRCLVVRAPVLMRERIDFCVPIVIVQRLGPAHFARDNLIALRVVQISLQQLHVFFGFLVLQLKEAFPVVLVPDRPRLAPEIAHA